MLNLVLLLFIAQAHAEKIVVIGDSHSCGDFGARLVRNLSAGGDSVVMYCAGGLSVQHFLNGFKPTRPSNNCKTFSSNHPAPVLCGGNGHSPALKDILLKEKPDRVVPALGTNNLALNSMNKFKPFADQLKASNVECIWVGPPALGTNGATCRQYGQNLVPLIEKIKAAVQPHCAYIDSRNHTDTSSTPDCIHRFGEAARRWADGVSGEIRP